MIVAHINPEPDSPQVDAAGNLWVRGPKGWACLTRWADTRFHTWDELVTAHGPLRPAAPAKKAPRQ